MAVGLRYLVRDDGDRRQGIRLFFLHLFFYLRGTSDQVHVAQEQPVESGNVGLVSFLSPTFFPGSRSLPGPVPDGRTRNPLSLLRYTRCRWLDESASNERRGSAGTASLEMPPPKFGVHLPRLLTTFWYQGVPSQIMTTTTVFSLPLTF